MALKVFTSGEVLTAADVNQYLVNKVYREKASTETVTSSTALQNDNDLFATLSVASATYKVTLQLYYTAATGEDLKIGFTGPSGFSFNYAAMGLGSAATVFTDDQTGFFEETNTPIFGGIGAGTTAALMLIGRLKYSATTGTFRFQFAQGTSGGTGTAVSAASWMLIEQVN